jgi:glycosyltransferase involved in cell wall biosynthesis
MRAGLFLEGLSRSHDVRVLVAPVFGAAAAPGPLVTHCASQFDMLELDGDPLRDLAARAATPSSRARAQALFPRPALSQGATLTAAAAVADAATGCVATHVMRLYLAPFLDALLEREDRPRLMLDIDDLESDTRRSFGPTAVDEAARYARLEAHYLPLLDAVTVSTREDAAVVEARHSPGRVVHVPNAVRVPQPDEGQPDEDLHVPSSDLLFVGNLSFRPNVDGARWLVEEILPLLADDVNLTMIGSRPAPEVLALATHPRVAVVPDVPSVGPWYRRATVAVAPLHSGGGTRIKVIEALAHGRPVVATRIGARGLELGVATGSPVLIADTPEEFALACGRLLDEPQLAKRLGAEGRARVTASLTVERVARQVDTAIRDMIAAS